MAYIKMPTINNNRNQIIQFCSKVFINLWPCRVLVAPCRVFIAVCGCLSRCAWALERAGYLSCVWALEHVGVSLLCVGSGACGHLSLVRGLWSMWASLSCSGALEHAGISLLCGGSGACGRLFCVGALERASVSLLWHVGLAAHGMWDLRSATRDWTLVSPTGRGILSQWTTREVPNHPVLKLDRSFHSIHFWEFDIDSPIKNFN